MSSYMDNRSFPNIVWELMKEFKVPVDCFIPGYILETHKSIDTVKEFLTKNFFSFLDTGETIWFYDLQVEKWRWITTRPKSQIPVHYTTDLYLYGRIRNQRCEFTLDSKRQYRILEQNYVIVCSPISEEEMLALAHNDPTLSFEWIRQNAYDLNRFPNINFKDELNTDLIPDELFKQYLKEEDGNSLGDYLRFLKNFGLLEKYMPELWENDGCAQDPLYHPDDVLTHLFKTLDARCPPGFKNDRVAKEIRELYAEDNIIFASLSNIHISLYTPLTLAALCHDIGKAATKQVKSDVIEPRSQEQLDHETDSP